MNKQELVEELRLSLPSKRMLEIVSNGAIQMYGDLILLKRREGTSLDNFIKWEENKGWQHDYQEIHGKNVIFSLSLFDIRGQQAILKYLESNE